MFWLVLLSVNIVLGKCTKKIDLSRLEMILTQKSSISTWIFRNRHVGKKHSPRGDEMKLRRNEMICPRNRFASTWRIKNSHVGN